MRIALSEGGTGWIPYFLDRVDRTFEMHHTWTLQDFGGRLPSEVFRQHFLTCFISDRVGIELRHRIGIDNIAWEADYPHSDSMWPGAPEELSAVFTDNAVPRRRGRQDHPSGTPCAGTPSTPSLTCARRTRPSAPSAARWRATTCRSWP